MERFWSRVDKSGSCWLWLGGKDRHGYGVFWFEGRLHGAHRVAFRLEHGRFPVADTDHTCCTRACVNPAHLEDVSRRVNLLRGQTITARNAAATHCPHGHEYTPENTQLQQKKGTVGRKCRTCHRKDQLARYHRQKAVA